MPAMRVTVRQPWWKTALVGFALTLVFLAVGLWQLGVVAGAVAGFLSRGGREGGGRRGPGSAPPWVPRAPRPAEAVGLAHENR